MPSVLYIVTNDAEVTFFLIPTDEYKKVPKKLRQLEFTQHYADGGSYDDRKLFHKYFGIALNSDTMDSNWMKDLDELREATPIFEKYILGGKITFDLRNVMIKTICFDSDT